MRPVKSSTTWTMVVALEQKATCGSCRCARIIHCTRDPRDIGLSIYQLRFFGYHPYAHDLADLGWTIGAHARQMAHWREVLPLSMLGVGAPTGSRISPVR